MNPWAFGPLTPAHPAPPFSHGSVARTVYAAVGQLDAVPEADSRFNLALVLEKHGLTAEAAAVHDATLRHNTTQ